MDPLFKKDLISNREAAQISGYTSDYLARLCRTGKIQGKQIGRTWFIERASLEDFVKSQGDRNIDRARALARAREEEYQRALETLREENPVVGKVLRVPSAPVLTSFIRREGFALLVACVVVGGASALAHASAFLALFNNAGDVVFATSQQFSNHTHNAGLAIADRMARIDAEIARAQKKSNAHVAEVTEMLAPSFLAYPDVTMFALPIERAETLSVPSPTSLLSFSQPVHTFSRPSVSDILAGVLRIPNIVATLAQVPGNFYRAIGTTGYEASRAAVDSYIAYVNRAGAQALALGAATRDALTRAPVLAIRFNLFVGNALINAAHTSIAFDTSFAYGTALTAPKVARVTTTAISDLGEHLIALASQTPHKVQNTYLAAASMLASGGPALAEAGARAEYVAANSFVSSVNALLATYDTALTSTGALAYTVTQTAFEKNSSARATISNLPLHTQGLVLGVVGKGVVAAGELTGALSEQAAFLAAVAQGVPALGSGERVALTTYETVNGWFTGIGNTFTSLFAPPPVIVLPFIPTRHVVVATTTSPQATSAVTKTYATYQTVVQGVSADFVRLSLDGLRSNILQTVANMIPQIPGRVAVDQIAPPIQELSGITITGSTIDGSDVTNAGTVSGTNGAFTTLSVTGTTTTAHLTVSGFSNASTECLHVDSSGNISPSSADCGTGGGNVSTSTPEIAGGLAYWTSTGGTPAMLSTVSTTTLSATGPLSLSGTTTVIGASPLTLSLGTVPVTSGGTGWSNLQANSILLGNGTGSIATTSAGTNGQVLALVNGVPTWQATTTLANISGTLPTSSGGTGTSTWLTNSIPYFNGASFTENTSLSFDGAKLSATYASTTAFSSSGSASFATGGGSVGIGIGSTGAKLQVNGSDSLLIGLINGATAGVRFGASSSGGSIEGVDNTGGISYQPLLVGGSALQFFISGIEKARIETNGNVGIGTTTPARTLSVQGNGLFSGNISVANITATGTITAGSLALTTALPTSSGGTGTSTWLANSIPFFNGTRFTENTGLTFDGTKLSATYASTTALSSSGSAYFATGGGSVGVGTSSPWAQLSVNPNGVTGPEFAIGSSTKTDFVVTKAGNVGIGTSDPDAQFGKLVVVGSQSRFLSSGQGDFYIIHANLVSTLLAAGGVQLALGANGNEAVRINSSGNVGIGTTSPSQPLSVQGNGLFSGNLSVANLTATGTITANSLALTSALPVTSGGTGWSNLQANSILLGNGSGALATTSAGANGQVLALVNGVPTWQATTTLSTISGTLVTSNGGTGTSTWLTNSIPYFNGTRFTENAGLTFDGTKLAATYASTTALSSSGSAYFATSGGNVGIGTTTPGNFSASGIGALTVQSAGGNQLTLNSSVSGQAAGITFAPGNSSRPSWYVGAETVTGNRFQITPNSAGAFSTPVLTLSANALGVLTNTPNFRIETTGSTGNGYFGITNSSAGDIFNVNGSGNVGIGTTSPTTALGVQGNGLFSGNISAANITATGTVTANLLTLTNALTIANGGTGANTFDQGWIYSAGGTGALAASTSPTINYFTATSTTATSSVAGMFTAGAGALNVLANGNVGIGTAVPNYKLDVNGTTRVANTLTLGTIASCIGSNALQTDASGNVACGTIATGGASSGGGWTTNNIGRVSLSTTTDQVVVGASTTPYAKLSVVSGSTATTTLVLLPASSQTANILDVYDNSGILSSVITPTGLFGIGTTAPSRALSVQGSALLSGNLSLANLTATGTATIGGALTVSGATSLAALTASGNTSLTQATSTTLFSTNHLTNTLSVGQTGTTTIASNGAISAPSLSLTTALGISSGGTGSTTAPSGQLLYGGASAYQSVATTTLTGSSITVGGSGAVVGGTGLTVNLNLGSANNWTALQSFLNASTTLFSNTGTAYFGGTSTTTITNTGAVGIGTSTPSQLLAVQGNGLISGNLSVANLTATGTVTTNTLNATTFNVTGTGTTTFNGDVLARGVSAWSYLNVPFVQATSSSATSVFSGNLTVSGNTNVAALTASGNTSLTQATTTTLFSTNHLTNTFAAGQTGTTTITSAGFLGVGSSTPWAQLSVNPNGVNGPEFAIGSSTKTDFVVTNAGNVGVGTSSPATGFAVSSNSYFAGTLGVGVTTPGSGASFEVDGNSGTLAVLNGTSGTYNGLTFQLSGSNNGFIGSGATLFNGGSSGDFGVRSVGGNLILSTSNASTTGIYIAGSRVGLSTTSPSQILSVQGNGLFSGNLSVANLTATGTATVSGAATLGSTLSVAGNTSLTQATTTTLFSTNHLTNTFAAGQTGTTTISSTGALSAPSLSLTTALGLTSGGTATTTFYSGGVVFSDGSKLTQSASASNFFWDETNKRFGLGSSSPLTKLGITVVNTSNQNDGLTIERGSGQNAIGLRLKSDAGGLFRGAITYLGTAGTEFEAISIGNNGGSNANIGIGTTSPASTLDVSSSDAATGVPTTFRSTRTLSLTNTSATDNNSNVLAFRTVDTTGTATTSAAVAGLNTSHASSGVSGALLFLTNNAGSFTEAGRFSSTGNFGLGTTSPYRTLSVVGSGVFTGGDVLASTLTATSTATAASFVGNSGSATSTLAGGLAIKTSGLVYDLSTNNVGINTATPAYKLEVNGTTRVASTFTLGTVASCTGSNALQTDGSGNVSCGTIALGGASSGGGWTTNNVGRVSLSTTTDQVVVGASTTPYAKLSVVSGSTATTTLVLLPASSQTANILDIYDNGGLLSSVVTASGSFGIGTTAPSRALSVQGSGLFSGNLSLSALTATSTITAGATTTATYFAASTLGTAGAPAFTFSNDLNTGLWSPTADTLAFSTGGSEQVRIDSSGRVGIGTNAPTSLLHIAGNISQSSWTTNGPVLQAVASTLTDTTSSGTVSTVVASTLGQPTFAASSAETITNPINLRVVGPAAGTNVTFGGMPIAIQAAAGGISISSSITGSSWTTSGAQLSVVRSTLTDNSSTAGSTIGTRAAVSFANPAFAFTIGTSTVTNAANVLITGAPTSDSASSTIITNASALLIAASATSANVTTNSYGLTVNAMSGAANNYAAQFIGGNVGIGTSTPTNLLSLSGSNANTTLTTLGTPALQISNSNTTNNNFESLAFRSINSVGAEFTAARLSGINTNHTSGSEAGDLAFLTMTGGTIAENARLTAAGNFGIGTTSPYRTLSVVGSGVFTGGDVLTSTLTATSTITSSATTTATYFAASTLGFAGAPSFTFSNDLDTGVWSSGANTLSLSTGGSERLRVLSSGNISINQTTNQGAQLEIGTTSAGAVTNALVLTNGSPSSVGTGVALHFDPNGAGGLARTASIQSRQTTAGNFADLGFFTSPGNTPLERLTITALGNVGIGTTSPYRTLSVVGSGVFTGGDVLASTLTATSSISTPAFNVTGTGTTTFNGDILARGISAWQYLNVPFVQATSTTATSTFAGGATFATGGGNVGIGTTTPPRLLSVQGSGLFSGALSVASLTSTTSIAVTSGGTGWGNVTAGALLYGNGTGALATTTTTGVAGKILAFLNGIPTWVATTTSITSIDDGGTPLTGGITLTGASATTNGVTNGITVTDDGISTFTFTPTISGTLTKGGGGTGTTTFYSGGVVYSDGTKLTQSAAAANFFWDETNKRLGIGTSSPSFKLDVLQANNTYGIRTQDGTTEVGLGVSSGSQGIVGTKSNHDLQIRTNNTVKLTVDTSGNVGIGTSTPATLFHLQSGGNFTGTTNSNNLGIFAKTTTSASQATLGVVSGSAGIAYLTLGGDGATSWDDGRVSYDASNSSLGLWTNNSQKLTIDTSGNVGIGTTTPSRALDVYTNSAAYAGIFQGSGSAAVGIGSLSSAGIIQAFTNDSLTTTANLALQPTAGNVGIGTTSPWGLLSVNPSALGSGVPEFVVGSSTATHLLVTGAGNVGIGTTSPYAALSVVGASGVVADKFTATSTGFFAPAGSASAPGLTFAPDTNTGFFRPTTDNVAVTTAGSERLRVDSSGNVGIGTTSPRALLAVQGNGLFSGNLSVANLTATGTISFSTALGIASGGTATTTFYSGGVVYSDGTKLTQSASASNFFWDETNKRLGIGTSSPKKPLHIEGTEAGIFLEETTGGIDNEAYIVHFSNALAFQNRTSTGVFVATPYKFDITAPGSTIVASAAGNVGIGTANPGALLDVASSTTNIGVLAQFGNSSIAGGLQVITSNGTTEWGLNARNSRNLVFQTNQTERLRIDSSGNVGIGTTSPSYKLHLGTAFTSNADDGIIVQPNTSQLAARFGLKSDSGGTYRGAITLTSTTGADTEVLSFPHTASLIGNVGIGTTSPRALLAVQGNGLFSGNISAANITATGTLTVAGLTNTGTSTATYFAASTRGFAGAPAYTFSSDLDTGVWSSAANTLNFSTAGAEAMRIDSSGNVGIGTTTPRGKLSMISTESTAFDATDGQGQATLGSTLEIGNAGASNNNFTQILFNNRTGSTNRFARIGSSMDAGVNSVLTFTTGTLAGVYGERMRIDGSGNVGIGTTTPWATFAVNPVAGAASNQFVVGSSTATSFIINNSGNIGIGSTSPSQMLTLAGGNIWQTAMTPAALGSVNLTTGNNSRGAVVSGHYDYVVETGTTNTLDIFDITNPNSPTFIASTTLSSPGNGIPIVSGGYLYIPESSTSLSVDIFDISNAKTPVKVATINNVQAVKAIGLSGRYLYVGGTTLLKVYDISNPTLPVLAGSVTPASVNNAFALAVQGPYVYLAGATSTPGGLDIIDVSNAAAPVNIGSFTVLAQPRAVSVSGRYAYVGTNNATDGLYVLDVSDPTTPTQASLLATNTNMTSVAVNMVLAGQYLYYPSGSGNSLQVIDVSNPAAPSITSSVGASNVIGLSVVGKYIYAASSGGTATLKVYDIAGASLPTASIGSIATDQFTVSGDANFAHQVYVQGGVNVGNAGIFSRGGLGVFVSSTTAANPIAAEFMGGNVGIGTTSPTAQLSIGMASSTDAFVVGVAGSSTPAFIVKSANSMGFVGVGTSTPWAQLSINPNALGSGVPEFVIGSSTRTHFIVDGTGNVGIGSTSPSVRLSVLDTTVVNSEAVATFSRSTAGGGAKIAVNNILGGDTTDAIFAPWGVASGGIAFVTISGGSEVNRGGINSAGNFGIGTTSPQWKLNIAGATAPQLTIGDGTNTNPWSFRSVGGAFYLATSSPTTFATSTNTALAIVASGNVGIASSSPFGVLSIGQSNETFSMWVGAQGSSTPSFAIAGTNGNGRVDIATSTLVATSTALIVGNNSIPSGTGIAVFGNAGGVCTINNTGISCSSDRGLKKNITALSPSLNPLLALAPVTYNWIPEAQGAPTHTGFIAQDVETLLPDLVSIDLFGNRQLNYAGFTPYIVSALQQVNGALDVTNALTGTSTLRSFYQGTSTPAIVVDTAGNVGIGTNTPHHTLDVQGDVAAISFVNTSTKNAKTDITYLTPDEASTVLTKLQNLKVAEYRYKIESASNPLRLGLIAEDAQQTAPEVLSVDGKGVDIYKLTTFTLAGVQALAAKLDAQATRMNSLETRIAKLEDGSVTSASGSPITFSTSTLTTMLNDLGILVSKGIAQFNTLVFRQLVASKDADGTSSAGNATILAGNTVVQVNNSLVASSTKVFVTFGNPVTGSWYVGNKQGGSFRVVLTQAQPTDVSFDYFLVQTEGQMATSTPLTAAVQDSTLNPTAPPPAPPPAPTPPPTATTTSPTATTTPITAVSDTTAPVVTLTGSAAIDLTVGATFTDPGATALDETDGDLTTHIIVSGTVDTATAGLYTLTYTVTDAAGNTGTVSRVVTVQNAAQSAPPPALEPAPEPSPAPAP